MGRTFGKKSFCTLLTLIISLGINAQVALTPSPSQNLPTTPTLTLTSQTQPNMFTPKPGMMYPQTQNMRFMPYPSQIRGGTMMGYPGYPTGPMMMSPMPGMNPYGQPMPYNMYSQYPRGLVQTPQPTPHERELTTILTEKTKLHDFFAQFIIVSKKHTFVTFPKFKYFYINYLDNAEETLHINHQERIYLEQMSTVIFMSSYSKYSLHYTQIQTKISMVIDHEHSDILLALSNNKPFTMRFDYEANNQEPQASNLVEQHTANGTKRKTPLQVWEAAKFARQYQELKKMLNNEQKWHTSLRNGKRDKISSIRRIELRKSIRAGQRKVKRLLATLKKFEKRTKHRKISKQVQKKLKVIRYFLDLLFDRSIGKFFSKISSYYHETGLDEKAKLASTRISLKKKVRILLKTDKPLRFLITTQRILKLNEKTIRASIKKAQIKLIKENKLRTNVNSIINDVKDPRQRAILEVYIEQTKLRIQEIDFFLFDSPGQYFDLDLIRLFESILSYPSMRSFVQFNANLDLLFMQIAKIEAHLKSGQNMEILPTVRQKYFQFFEKLIQPLIKPKPDFNLPQIEEKDREVFQNMKAIEAFRKVVDGHLNNKYKGKKIADIDLDYLDEHQDLSFENDVHEYLKDENKKNQTNKPLWDEDETSSWSSNDSFYKEDEGKVKNDTSEIDNDQIRQFKNLEVEFLDIEESESGGNIRPGHRRKETQSESSRKKNSSDSGSSSIRSNTSRSGAKKTHKAKDLQSKNKNSKQTQKKAKSDHSSEESLSEGSGGNIRPGHRKRDNQDESTLRRKEETTQTRHKDSESQATPNSGSAKDESQNQKKVTLNKNDSTSSDKENRKNRTKGDSKSASNKIGKKNSKKNQKEISESGIAKNTQILDSESEDTRPLDLELEDPMAKLKLKQKKDIDEDHTIRIDNYDTDDGNEQHVANLNVKLKNKDQIEGAEVEVTQTQVTNKPNGPKLKNVPVKVKQNTVRQKVWEHGGFKKRKKKYDDQAFQTDEDILESMVVSMGDLKKVKVNKLLVLKTKILSELFLAFFKNEDENTTLQMLSSSKSLDQDGIVKKSLSQKLNYLLMIVVEGRKMRQGLVLNPYFDEVIRLWKLFLVEYSSTCQLKLYIKLLKKMDLIDPPRRRAVWANLMIFLKEHRQFDFVTCPQMILSMWMNKNILAQTVANHKTIRASFQKVFVKFKHQEKVKATERKKLLLKKILKKIQSHTANDAELEHFDKTVLLAPTSPGNKKKDKSSPNSQIDVLDGRFKGSSIQSIMKKPTMAKLMGHLNKLKLKSSKKVNKKFMKFTKSLVIGALLSGQNVHANLSSLAKLRFKMTRKKLAYIKRLKTEFRNVDNIRVSNKYHHIFSNLRKIFFKHREHPDESVPTSEPSSKPDSTPSHSIKSSPKDSTPVRSRPNSEPSRSSSYHSERSRFSERLKIEPPKMKKHRRRWGKRISKRKKSCRTRIFKKCKCTGSGTPGGSGGTGGDDLGCCGDGTGDESIYNYRPSYEFKFEFEDPEELAQFEEFLRTTDSIDKLYSSNMIDVEKARNEFKKAEFSKHYTVTVNGKKASPENILVPRPQSDLTNPDKKGNTSKGNESPADKNSHDSEDLHSHPNKYTRTSDSQLDQSDMNRSTMSSPEHPSQQNLKFNSLGDPQMRDIESPFNDDTWEQDLKKIDDGIRNQPSIEDGVHVRQIPVDENGIPIDLNHQGDPLDQKVKEREEQDEDIREFIKRNRPIDDNLNNSQTSDLQNNSQDNSQPAKDQDELDKDVEDLIEKDIQDKDILDANPMKFGKQGDLEDESPISGIDSPQDLESREDELDNKHVNLTDIDTSEVSHEANMVDANDLSTPQKLDNLYSGELVDRVEDELDKKLPMKKFTFGAKDWNTNQVYTNDIKDEGMLGSGINKYPAMSDAMKSKLDKEIQDNGGYPDDLDANPGKKKMVYFPFHVQHGDLEFDPASNQQFLL